MSLSVRRFDTDARPSSRAAIHQVQQIHADDELIEAVSTGRIAPDHHDRVAVALAEWRISILADER